MKLFFRFFTIFVFLVFVLLSCSENVNIMQDESDISTNLRNAEMNYGLALPNETVLNHNTNFIEFTLPQDYYLLGFDEQGVARATGGGKLTCTCETAGSTGACTATETDKTVGCNTEKSNPCPTCKGTVSATSLSGTYKLVEYYIQVPIDQSTSFSLFSEMRACEDLEEWNSADWLNSETADLAEINTIINYVWEGHDEGSKVIDVLMISEAGKFTLEVPQASLEAGNIYTATGKTTCSGCDGKCKLKKAAFGKVRYCDGCASGCSISW